MAKFMQLKWKGGRGPTKGKKSAKWIKKVSARALRRTVKALQDITYFKHQYGGSMED